MPLVDANHHFYDKLVKRVYCKAEATGVIKFGSMGCPKNSKFFYVFGGFMMVKRLALVLAASVFAAACTCRPHKAIDYGTGTAGLGTDDTNVSAPVGDGPLKDIYFAFDSYALTETSKAVLRANAAYVKEKSAKVEIEGHCDERGTNEYNMVLGAKRARAALDYLVALGVPSSSLTTVSYGEELPLDPRHDEGAWAKNRRDHFKILP